jgi:hypothetical protein
MCCCARWRGRKIQGMSGFEELSGIEGMSSCLISRTTSFLNLSSLKFLCEIPDQAKETT